jgi:hypothetical protein
MADDPITPSALFRDVAERLWRLSSDRSKNVPYETRRELGRMADEFEKLAERVRENLVS